ncbi:hypothetical protein DFJ73DRAFT_935650 [Zopfochytrium polystomum]|nr:hypothetical protein DFJ73DRAFT_935650 [Zopfochytrium polystomum]
MGDALAALAASSSSSCSSSSSSSGPQQQQQLHPPHLTALHLYGVRFADADRVEAALLAAGAAGGGALRSLRAFSLTGVAAGTPAGAAVQAMDADDRAARAALSRAARAALRLLSAAVPARLTHLDLSGVPLTADDAATVRIDCCCFGGGGGGVATLRLSRCELDDAGAAALAAALDGSVSAGCGDDDDGDVGSLAVVDVSANAFGREGAAALAAALGRLGVAELDVSENPRLGADGVAAIVAGVLAPARRGAGLRRRRRLEVLDLSRTEAGDDGAAAVAVALEAAAACGAGGAAGGGGGTAALRVLRMDRNRIAARGAAALAAAVAAGAAPALAELSLAANEVGDGGAAALAGALRGGGSPTSFTAGPPAPPPPPPPLRRLVLARNGITETGVAALADALESSSASSCGFGDTLSELDLSSNSVSDGAASAAVQRLTVGAGGRLAALDAVWWGAPAAAADPEAVAEAVARGGTLVALRLVPMGRLPAAVAVALDANRAAARARARACGDVAVAARVVLFPAAAAAAATDTNYGVLRLPRLPREVWEAVLDALWRGVAAPARMPARLHRAVRQAFGDRRSIGRLAPPPPTHFSGTAATAATATHRRDGSMGVAAWAGEGWDAAFTDQAVVDACLRFLRSVESL